MISLRCRADNASKRQTMPLEARAGDQIFWNAVTQGAES